MNKKTDYSKLEEITIKSQNELDEIPLNFKGRIYIKFGDYWNPGIIKNRYYYTVEAYNNSTVKACGNSTVEACDNSTVIACDNSTVEACDNSTVGACNNSTVRAYNNSTVEAYNNSTVEACGNSTVEACGNSTVRAYNNSTVRAYGNVQVLDRQHNGKINISENSRIVYMPKNINEFIDFHNIKHTKTTAIFYKAVRKDANGVYRADRDNSFIYEIGKYKTEQCDPDTEEDCSCGIHISTLKWALNYGKRWNNLAILELKTKISDIVLPKNSDEKVRTSKVKVLREVPLQECRIHGKILAKRRQVND